MAASDLRDDLDKLSQILNEPDPEDLSGEYDDRLLDSKCEISEESDEHHIIIPTSPLKYACQSSNSTPDVKHEEHECDQSLNKNTPSVEPEDQQSSIHSASPVSLSIHTDQNDEFAFHLSDGSMELQTNGGRSSFISPTAGVDLAEPPGKPSPPPALDNQASGIPSQTHQSGMPPPPAPDDVLQDFEGLIQESCAPDFDPPDEVVDIYSGAAAAGEVSDSEGGVANGGQDMTACVWLRVEQSAEQRSDTGRISPTLDVRDGGGDRGGGEDQWGEDASPVAPHDPAESTVLGDINKLSQALATAPVVTPMQLDPVSRPTVAPSMGRVLSTERGGGSGSRQPSVASTSGAQLPSAFGDELLSQDDFLDDTFIGQDIPVNLENCLALNAAYQEVVDENLADLEQLLHRNRARQAEMTTLLNTRPLRGMQSTRCTRWNWHQFIFHHFADANGFGPMPNVDTVTKTERCEYEDLRWPRPWLQSEREKLFEAMLVEVRHRHERVAHHRVHALRNALRQLEVKLEPEQREAALTSLRNELEEAERILTEAKDASVLEILAEMDDQYDWQKIAQTSLKGERSASECRLQWCNFVRPTISHAAWTPGEDKRVRAAADANKSDNRWQAAADELGRTAFQVFQRWATVLSAPGRTFWTNEESEQLITAARSLSMGNYINWSLVALRLPGRTANQCNQRHTSLVSQRCRGRFSEQEDMRLIAAVEEAGMTDFRAISAYIPGRAPSQLQNRYVRYLSPTLSRRDWTREEDEQLVRFVSKHGSLWARAAAEIGNNRNGSQCRMRFIRIELAYQSQGGVPAKGSLGGKAKKYWTDYYANLREQLNRQLEQLKPDGEKDSAEAEARKQAALALLKRKMPKPKVKRASTRVRMAMVRKSNQVRQLKWDSLWDVVLSEGRQPHRRVPAPGREAEAAAVTARAWCLPQPTTGRLSTCASARPPTSEYDAAALTAWRAALLTDTPESSLRRAVLAVGQREYNWRRMPLLPASFASCNAFRSLMLQRPRFEEHAVEIGGPAATRRRKTKMFNLDLASWAKDTMSGRGDGSAESTTPWLVPTDQTRHQDRVVRVRITEQPPGDRPPRQFHLTVAAAEANDPQQLANRIIRQVPHMVKMDISRAPVVRDAPRQPPPPGPPPAASAADAWHLLLTRFVSMFFWPALLSLQPPPGVTDLGGPDLDDEELVDSVFGGLLVVNSDDDDEDMREQQQQPKQKKQKQKRKQETRKRAPGPHTPGPKPKRKKQ